MERRPAYHKRFDEHLQVLKAYIEREEHCTVPVAHVEKQDGRDFRLGAWVSYQRTRHRQNRLPVERVEALSALSGWQWGPLRPGPAPQTDRNETIRQERVAGAGLGELAQRYGLSRQRIHQIVTGSR